MRGYIDRMGKGSGDDCRTPMRLLGGVHATVPDPAVDRQAAYEALFGGEELDAPSDEQISALRDLQRVHSGTHARVEIASVKPYGMIVECVSRSGRHSKFYLVDEAGRVTADSFPAPWLHR